MGDPGFGLLPVTAVNCVVAMALPRLSDRVGSSTLLATRVVAPLVGAGWLSQADAGEGYWLALALPMLLIGASVSRSSSPPPPGPTTRPGSSPTR